MRIRPLPRRAHITKNSDTEEQVQYSRLNHADLLAEVDKMRLVRQGAIKL
ncbi:MAG: hypothetical protein GX351_12350 [Peptococcaceae bacterium]|nr:hypothetical protein [Peptococcaceae bacterium]